MGGVHAGRVPPSVDNASRIAGLHDKVPFRIVGDVDMTWLQPLRIVRRHDIRGALPIEARIMPSTKPARMCCTTSVGGQLAGKAVSTVSSALTPPVDAPRAMSDGMFAPETTGEGALRFSGRSFELGPADLRNSSSSLSGSSSRPCGTNGMDFRSRGGVLSAARSP
jgi:hypothetical protein